MLLSFCSSRSVSNVFSLKKKKKKELTTLSLPPRCFFRLPMCGCLSIISWYLMCLPSLIYLMPFCPRHMWCLRICFLSYLWTCNLQDPPPRLLVCIGVIMHQKSAPHEDSKGTDWQRFLKSCPAIRVQRYPAGLQMAHLQICWLSARLWILMLFYIFLIVYKPCDKIKSNRVPVS